MRQDHGGNIKEIAKKFNLKDEAVIDFSANINFLGPPEKVIENIKDEVFSITKYPEPNSDEFKDELASKFNLDKDRIIIGNGAVELIYVLARVIKPKRSLLIAPTFSEYERAVRIVGSKIKYHYLKKGNDFKIDLNLLLNDLDNSIDLFFLCNPNNPTGNYLNKDQILKVIEHNEKEKIFTVIDEAFIDFIDQEITAMDYLKNFENIFILRSLTKMFAVPGLRIGYGLGNSALVMKMIKNIDPWNLNIFAQKAAKIIIKEQDYVKRSLKKINKEKMFLYNELNKIKDIKTYYPNANYILIDISGGDLNSKQLYTKLAKKGLLIRNCSNYEGLDQGYIRVAVRSRNENIYLIDSLKEYYK